MAQNPEQRTLGLRAICLISQFSKPYKWWLKHSTPSAQAIINGHRLLMMDNFISDIPLMRDPLLVAALLKINLRRRQLRRNDLCENISKAYS